MRLLSITSVVLKGHNLWNRCFSSTINANIFLDLNENKIKNNLKFNTNSNQLRSHCTSGQPIQRPIVCSRSGLSQRNVSTITTTKPKSSLKSESQQKLAAIMSNCPTIESFPLLKQKDFEINEFKTQFKEVFESIKRCEEINLNNISYFPSVSTILNTTMSVQSVIALDKWKKLKINELGEQGFRDYQKNILSRGKLLHLNIKNFIQTNDESSLQLNQSIDKLWLSLAKSRVIEDISAVELCEAKISHPFLCYMGIVDCVAVYSGKLVLIEWKTSEKLKPTLKDIYDNPLQAVAYMGAINYETNHSLAIDEMILVYAYEDGSDAQIHRLDVNLCHKYWNQWLIRVKSYWDLIAFKQTLSQT